MNKLIIAITLALACAVSCKSADADDLSSTMQKLINPIRKRLPSAPSMPDISMPSMPDVSMPDMKMPDMSLPDMKMPDMKMPNMKMPNMDDLVKRMQSLEQSLSNLPMSDLPKRTQKEVHDLLKRLRNYIIDGMLPDLPNMPSMPNLPGPRVPSPPRPRLP